MIIYRTHKERKIHYSDTWNLTSSLITTTIIKKSIHCKQLWIKWHEHSKIEKELNK